MLTHEEWVNEGRYASQFGAWPFPQPHARYQPALLPKEQASMPNGICLVEYSTD